MGKVWLFFFEAGIYSLVESIYESYCTYSYKLCNGLMKFFRFEMWRIADNRLRFGFFWVKLTKLVSRYTRVWTNGSFVFGMHSVTEYLSSASFSPLLENLKLFFQVLLAFVEACSTWYWANLWWYGMKGQIIMKMFTSFVYEPLRIL